MPSPQIPLVSDIPLSAAEKLAIRQAAQGWPGVECFSELRIVRQLNEGFSSARVYEAEWVSSGPATSEGVILKVDKAVRLVQEIRFSQAFQGEAPSFMKVKSASFPDLGNPPNELGCIFYAHAGGQFPGEIRTLASLCEQALQDGTGFQSFKPFLDSIFGILRKQLHKSLKVDSPQRQLDFYLKRWLPTAELECRQVEWKGSGRVRLFLADHPAQEQPDFGGSEEVDSALTGSVVAFEAAELHLTESSIYVNQPHESCFLITGISPDLVQESCTCEPQAVRVEGRVIRTRLASYQEVFKETGLDPAADKLYIGSVEFTNPLTGFQTRVQAWARRLPWPSYCFGHGDLHGGNVLSAGVSTAIIDHALSGDSHPAWADAARLIGSLWRNALAPRFQSEELARILDLAFRQKSELTDESSVVVAAALLRRAFESAISAGPSQEEARKELWIDLHHFAWIGLKWPGQPQAHLAMILLAALAVEKVEAESLALGRRQELRSSIPARLDSEGLVQDVPAHLARLKAVLGELAEPGSEALWQFRDVLQRLATEQLRELEADPGASGGLLGRLLDKALTRSWSSQDTSDANSVRLGEDGLYSSRDRVVLADVLFFACAFSWSEQLFGLLLDLCNEGDEEVEAEAAMALAWLLSQEAVRGRIEAEPTLPRRVEALLSRRDFVELVWMAARARLEVMSALPGLQFIEPTEPVPRIEHLRPFDPEKDIPPDARASAPELAELLPASLLLTESGKRAVGRQLASLSQEEGAKLLQRLRKEAARNSLYDPALLHCYRRTLSLCRFAKVLQQEDQEDELRKQLLLFQRSFTDLVGDEALKHLAKARELSLASEMAPQAEDRSRELGQSAIRHFELAASRLSLDAEDLHAWGFQAGRLAAIADDVDEQRKLRLEACEKYNRAVDVKPDTYDALNNWGNELGLLAALADDADEQRKLRLEACEKYNRAVDVKPDTHEALYNWGIELGRLAALADDADEQRKLRLEACEKYSRAVEVKPDTYDALNNWGNELGQLAALTDDADEQRKIRREACEKYSRAVEVKPDKHDALYNWGNELGRLAALADDADEQRKIRREACEKYSRAVEVKPDKHDALNNWGAELLRLAEVSPESERERICDLAKEVLERYALGAGIPLAQVYNHACVLARLGRRSEALSSLKECLASGEISVEHVRQDPDWAGLRGDPEFEALLTHSESPQV